MEITQGNYGTGIYDIVTSLLPFTSKRVRRGISDQIGGARQVIGKGIGFFTESSSKGGTRNIPLMPEPTNQPKQLGDGGRSSQKMIGDGGAQERINSGKLLPERSSVGNSSEVTELPQTSRSTKLELLKRIREATQSSNPDKQLEGQVARKFRDQLVDFNKQVPNKSGRGNIGEIDVELNNSIIEVTNKPGGKVTQINKLCESRVEK